MSNAESRLKKGKIKQSLLYRLFSTPIGAFSTIVILVYLSWAIAPEFFAHYDPARAYFTDANLPISFKHLLGTDEIGRDVFSQVVWSSRPSFQGAAIGVSVALFLGCGTGVIAGYFGGWFDAVGNWFCSLIQSLPALIVLLSIVAIVGSDIFPIMIVFGIMLSTMFFRLTSVVVRNVSNELYVDAARVSGLSSARIMMRHVIPVIRAPIIIQLGFTLSIAVTIQSVLQFLGVGSSAIPGWGSLLNAAYKKIQIYPAGLIIPTIVLGAIMIALVQISNTMRDLLQETTSITPRAVRRAAKAVVIPEQVPVIEHAARQGQDNVLEIKDLAIGYPSADGTMKVVVSSAQLTVGRGEVVGLVGESGSGKTQTAFATLGLLSPGGKILKGSISFMGKDLTKIGEAEYESIRGTKISYIPQEPMSGLDPSFTIGSQLTEALRDNGMGRSESKKYILDLLKRVGMPDPAKTFNSYPHEVSGGQAQRVLIAGALSLKPDLIIADEPTTALDVTVQAEILDLLRSLQRESGVAVVMVTHNFAVVADICDRVVIMQNGCTVEEGSTEEIFSGALHAYTRDLLSSIIDESTPARAPYAEPGTGAADATPLLTFDNVEVTYHGKRLGKAGFKALKGISLDIRPGETLGLVGESGSGKTTLGRAVLGLAPVTGGRVLFEGQDIAKVKVGERREIAKHLQVVFQDPYTSLNPAMNIGEILAEPLLAQGISSKVAMARVKDLLDSVALPASSIERRAREFSGGQRQRIAIARALALEPKLIVCDEPVSALDLSTASRVLDLFQEIQDRTGVAYLFISHDLAVVRHMSHRVAVMYQGEIVEAGSGDQVTSDPKHPYTQKLLMASPVADPARQAARRTARQELLRAGN